MLTQNDMESLVIRLISNLTALADQLDDFNEVTQGTIASIYSSYLRYAVEALQVLDASDAAYENQAIIMATEVGELCECFNACLALPAPRQTSRLNSAHHVSKKPHLKLVS